MCQKCEVRSLFGDGPCDECSIKSASLQKPLFPNPENESLEDKISRLEREFHIGSPLKQASIETESIPYFLQLTGEYDQSEIKNASVQEPNSKPYFLELGVL